MEVIRTVKQMQAVSDELRSRAKRVVLVPTMGFLHEGHLSLMRLGLQQADVLVVSIFVNPTQFGPGEDFESYPRDWDRDEQMVASTGAEYIFAPEVEEVYPQGYQTTVTVKHLTQSLCGLMRPVHFEGVATVVTKLFNSVKPHCAVFGEKDFQQLMVIRRMVRDLNFDIEIIGAPIVREADGIAMSSRNTYLSEEQRQAARSLYRSLQEAKKMVAGGERKAAALISRAEEIIGGEAQARIDYIKVCDVETLADADMIAGEAVMALAVHFGKARLIDNMVLKP